MGFWEDVKKKISNALVEIKKNPYLDAVAKSALESVPVLGSLLVKLYENSPDDEENKMEQIIKLLTNLEKLNTETLEEISTEIKNNSNSLINVNGSLSQLTNETSLIHEHLEKQDVDIIEVKIGQTKIHLDLLKIRKEQQKILNEVKDVGNTVKLLYEEVGTIQSKLGIGKEDAHVKFGSGYKIYCPDRWKILSKEDTIDFWKRAIRIVEEKKIPVEKDQSSKMDMMLVEKDGKIKQNVNIVISEIKQGNIIQNTNRSNLLLIQLGWNIVNQSIDELANTAIIETVIEIEGEKWFQIQKHYVRENKYYVMTMSDLKDEHLQNTPETVEDLKTIAQSFTFV